MPNEIKVKKTLDENIINHLRENFGKLITEEQLTEIFEKGIDKIINEPIRIEANSCYGSPTYKDSILIQALKEVAKPLINAHLGEFLKTREDEIMAEITKTYCDPQVLVNAVLGGALSQVVSSLQYSLQTTIQESLRQEGLNI